MLKCCKTMLKRGNNILKCCINMLEFYVNMRKLFVIIPLNTFNLNALRENTFHNGFKMHSAHAVGMNMRMPLA